MESKELSENHKRVISTTLKVVENSIEEILHLLNQPKSSFVKIEFDLDNAQIEHLTNYIEAIKNKLAELKIKYSLENQYYSFKQILNAKKSYIWVLLSDCKSDKLNKYGAFNPSISKEFDDDVNLLINMVNNL